MKSHHLTMFDGHWSNASGDIKYLICHVTSQKREIEQSSNFMTKSSSWACDFKDERPSW